MSTKDISDGHHTFRELYEHRYVLFVALLRSRHALGKPGWISRKHSDGTMWGNNFVAGIGTEPGKQITYHLKMRFWKLLEPYCTVLEFAPEYDGHTPDNTLDRLLELG